MELINNSCLFRHPKLPQPDACENTETWLNLYHATRPRIKHPSQAVFYPLLLTKALQAPLWRRSAVSWSL